MLCSCVRGGNLLACNRLKRRVELSEQMNTPFDVELSPQPLRNDRRVWQI